MRRFYSTVSTRQENGGFTILIDGKAVRTTSGNALLAPNQAIANEVMQEWSSQTAEINLETMPFTQILNTKIDRIRRGRKAVTVALLKYIDTDLLCYHAPDPEELVKLQNDRWQPFRKWFAQTFGHDLSTTDGLLAIAQSAGLQKDIRAYVESLDDDAFTILQWVTALGGSLVMALAFIAGAYGPPQVMGARFVEEDYKNMLTRAEVTGEDPVIEKIRAQTEQDLHAAKKYLDLIKSGLGFSEIQL
ncbi:MAG: ATP12 chaperone family protein [Rhodospirillales bacterium]|nr:ATP12 chaperone family protein [Alphaproteobacteria bacterium]MCB9976422.1 ATP12 chaperone family protein [Rhodospirillales bacterium]